VIARYIDDFGTLLSFSENRPDDVIVGLRPEQPFPHLPDIDDVTDEVEELAVDRVQKVEEMVGAAAAKTQMHIRNPNGAKGKGMVGDGSSHPPCLQ
jgi:hypothetical protein